MKRILFLIILVTLSTGLITSCSKDSGSSSNNLAGTSWVSKSTASGLNVVETLQFISSTNFTDVAVITGTTNTTLSSSGTYVYAPPSITLTPTTGSVIKGTINGNNLYAPSLNGTATITYVKQ